MQFIVTLNKLVLVAELEDEPEIKVQK